MLRYYFPSRFPETVVPHHRLSSPVVDFKAWKEAGIIKDVTAITAHMNMPRRWHAFNTAMKSMPLAEPVPSTLDWDCWLGTAQGMERVLHDVRSGVRMLKG